MILHVRVDDRLVHGQVVEGWVPVLQPAVVLVANDLAAKDSLQVSLMRLALPPEVALEVLPLREAALALSQHLWKAKRVLVLAESPADVVKLMEAGAPLTRVNLGGLHMAPGRRLREPNLALSPADLAALSNLLDRKVIVECQPLPGDQVLPAARYLD